MHNKLCKITDRLVTKSVKYILVKKNLVLAVLFVEMYFILQKHM
jgi:hypothetical protein